MNEKFQAIPMSDRPEMAENRKFTNSRKLFTKIMEDFSHSDFTINDIKDAYNKRTSSGTAGIGMRFGISHLDNLTADGFLDYDEENKTYSVNHANKYVAKFAMEN